VVAALDALNSNVNAIKARLTLVGGAGSGSGDSLRVYDAGDDARESVRLRAAELTGMGMDLGIGSSQFEELKVWLSNGDNAVTVESTHSGVTFIDTGDETPITNGLNDVVNIASIAGPTTIDAGNGNDVLRVNFDAGGNQTFRSGINGELTLHGQQGSDRYEIGLAGRISSRINVFDQSRGDPGINRLRIYGTDATDFFLFRANRDLGVGMVAAVQVDANQCRSPAE
jgi:hypothetical protein